MSESPPPSPVMSDEDQTGLPSGNQTDDVMAAAAVSLIRQSADGGSTQSLGSSQDGAPSEEDRNNSASAKERENIAEDLDKDIDAMADAATATGVSNPGVNLDPEEGDVYPREDNAHSVNTELVADIPPAGKSQQLSQLGLDLNSNYETYYKEKGSFESDNLTGNIVQPENVAERSFTSDTTENSAIAEAVVKTALSNAIDVMKSENFAGEGPVEVGTQISKDRKTDMPVGLFQYGGTGDNISVEDEESDDNDTIENEKDLDNVAASGKAVPEIETDVKVGLFQYTDESAENTQYKSPEVSEIDDDEEQVESFKEEDKENILQLYGLEDMVDPSPKSPSPKSTSPIEIKNIAIESVAGSEPIMDVQREVYEPQTRQFSVSQDTSSTETTPRYESKFETKIGGLDTANKNADSSVAVTDHVHNGVDPDRVKSTDTSQDGDTDITVEEAKSTSDRLEDNVLCGTGTGVPFDISPPLIQYESVKENGKFRIIKTPKEGGGSSYTTIRVGAETSSPKQSPRETPAESDSSLKSDEDTVMRLTNNAPASHLHERKSEGTNNGGSAGSDSQPKRAVEIHIPERSMPYVNAADIIDRERIRQLVEKETSMPYEMAASKDSVNSAKSESVSSVVERARPPQSVVDSHSHEDRKSPKQMTISELKVSPRDRMVVLDSEHDRIKYTTMDTNGRAVQRTGPSPYEMAPLPAGDQLKSESRYLEVKDGGEPYTSAYSRDRYTSNLSGLDAPHQSLDRFPSSYQADLIQSAYDRVSQRGRETGTSHGAHRPLESGVIPGFKTLQEQQASWSTMFHHLEEQHRSDLQSQYEQHQRNIRRLQQQMELELQKQHLAIRTRLDIHKEALISPEREQRYSSPGRASSPDRGQRSPERSRDQRSWREIYREEREKEERRDPTPPPPLKRSLNDDFDVLDSSEQRSRSSMHNSTGTRGAASRSRSQGRTHDRSIEERRFERSLPERDLSLRSVEGEESRSFERDTRSRSKRNAIEPVQSLSPRDAPAVSTKDPRQLQEPVEARSGREPISPYVQQLLENLSDTRSSLRGLQSDVTSSRQVVSDDHKASDHSERPRAGVYSSPMPVFRGSGSKEGVDVSRGSTDQSRLSIPVDKAEFHDDRRVEVRAVGAETLSSSGRLNLREKHSKHLADLRAYYEDEMRELRQALSESLDTSASSVNTSVQSSVQCHLLEAENKHLLDKCRTMESEIEELYEKIRILEQKNLGLEKRASEYSGAFAESQAMGIQHQAHIEELQRYCRERDDLVNDLESKVRSQEDSVKIYKKSFEEEMELHRQDKIALQRIVDKYECVEREHKLLQETMSTTESKLYETRTEVVELNRTISKLELENKRLGRENDNLRHKVTQSLNLSSLHNSFGSPVSPRSSQNSKQPASSEPKSHDSSLRYGLSDPAVGHGPADPPKSRGLSSEIGSSRALTESGDARGLSVSDLQPSPSSTDRRVPGFATSTGDWINSQKSRDKDAERSRSVSERDDRPSSNRADVSVATKSQRELKSRKVTKESSKGRKTDGAKASKSSSSEETQSADVSRRYKKTLSESEKPTRDITPPRPASTTSIADSEVSDYSPLIKAERELFKLRDMMRQAVAVKPSDSPPQPKLQKKYYGSERPSSKEDYTPDLGVARGKKERPSGHSGVAKTKSSQTHSKSDKSVSKSERKSGSRKSEKTSQPLEDRRERPRDRTPTRERDGARDRTPPRDGALDRTPPRDRDKQMDRTPPRKEFSVHPEEFGSPTRFDISVNEDTKTLNVTPRKATSSQKQRDLLETGSQSRRQEPYGQAANDGQLNGTLDRVRSGQYTTRPQWEDVFTSMARQQAPGKPAQESVEEKVKVTLRSISEMESRYDGLQAEKRQLESSITKIPLHGRVNVNNRRHKEELEDRLDAVEKELGSLRMSLKRYNVLKTAG